MSEFEFWTGNVLPVSFLCLYPGLVPFPQVSYPFLPVRASTNPDPDPFPLFLRKYIFAIHKIDSCNFDDMHMTINTQTIVSRIRSTNSYARSTSSVRAKTKAHQKFPFPADSALYSTVDIPL